MGVSGDLLAITNTNVGIGTTSPSEKLHVNGEVRVDGNDGVATKKVRSSYFSSTQNLDLVAGSSADIILTSDKVGIGTTSPEAKLTIKGDALNTNQPVRITNSVTDTHTGLFLNNTGSTVGEKYGMQFGGYNQYSIGGIFGVLDSVSGSTSGDITFDLGNGTSAGSLIERMRITHEGNVGIGTTSPSQKLEVAGNVKLGDSNKLLLGAGNDLEMFHDGSNSYIENYTGDFYFYTSS